MKETFLTPEQESLFSSEERKEIIHVMKSVADGRMTSEQITAYCEMLNKAVKGKIKPVKCLKCDDTGLVRVKEIKGAFNAFKCGGK